MSEAAPTVEALPARGDGQPEAALPMHRGLDLLVIVVASGTIGFHLALLVGAGPAVMAALTVLIVPALSWFVNADGDGRRGPLAVPVDRMSRSGFYGSAAALVVATTIAAWPDRPQNLLFGVLLIVLVALSAHLAGRSSPGSLASVPQRDLALVAVAAVAVAVVYVWIEWGWLLFVTLLLFFGVVGTRRWDGADRGSTPRPGAIRSIETTAMLAGFGMVLAVLQIFSPNGSGDDVYYIRRANVLADDPWGFATGDVLFGLADAPHVPPADVYQAQEAFVGLVSWVTGLNAWTIVLFGVAPLIGMLAPFAFARFAQSFGSHRPTFVAMVGVSVLVGSWLLVSERSFTGKAVQGKGTFLIVLLPILLAAAGDHLTRPSPSRLRYLLVVAIAALGVTVSASALVAPVVLLAVVGAARRDGFRSWVGPGPKLVSIGLSGLLALYPLIIFVLGSTADGAEGRIRSRTYVDSIQRGLGGGWQSTSAVAAAAALTLLFLALVLIPSMERRRFLALLYGLALCVILNPVLIRIASSLADATRAAWRFTWLIPTALLIAFAVDGLTSRAGRVGMVAGTVLFGLVLGFGGPSRLISRSNFPEVDRYEVVSEANWDAAGQIAELVEPDSTLLVDRKLAFALTLRTTDLHSVWLRANWAGALGDYPFERTERFQLIRHLENNSDFRLLSAEALVENIDLIDFDAACLPPSAHPNLVEALRQASYETEATITDGDCTLWIRS